MFLEHYLMQLMDLVAAQVIYNWPEGSQLFLGHIPDERIYAMAMGTNWITGDSAKCKIIVSTVSVVQHWSREAVESLFWEIFKTQWDMALSTRL